MKGSTVILILLGLLGFGFIFMVFLYPALKGVPPGAANATANATTANLLANPGNILANQGLAPMSTAAGTTGNLAITDASSLLSQLIPSN